MGAGPQDKKGLQEAGLQGVGAAHFAHSKELLYLCLGQRRRAEGRGAADECRVQT